MVRKDALVRSYEGFREVRQKLDGVVNNYEALSASDLIGKIQSAPFDDPKWVFRGQKDSRWGLEPGVERLANEKGISPHVERVIEREFKRRAHHYLRDLPAEEDDLEWLALMQHHGAPTRLLDWTASPYVATFFAAKSAASSMPFALWAIDRKSLESEAARMLGTEESGWFSSPENFRRVYHNLFPDDLYLVIPVEPRRMNERLTIQQGLFLCPNHPLMGFETNLRSVLVHAKNNGRDSSTWLHKFTIDPSARFDLLRLLKKMNISSATLYPGLDGFARSLRTNTEILTREEWYSGIKSELDGQKSRSPRRRASRLR